METTRTALQFPTSREEALALELLIDVEEWCQEHGLPPLFPFPTAMTRDLCDAIEAIPFGLIGETTPADRSHRVFERGAAALERCLLGLEDPLAGAPLETTFAAPLPRSTGDRAWSFVKLHCGPGDDARPVITLALPDEEL